MASVDTVNKLGGRVPTMELYDIYNTCKLTKDPIPAGIVPVSLFLYSSSVVRLVRLPSAEGSEPPREFEPSRSAVSFNSSPTTVGMVPPSLFPVMSSTVRAVSAPMLEGSVARLA